MKKIVYSLEIIRKYFKSIKSMPILRGKSFSYSVRDLTYKSDSIVEFYDRKHRFLGQDSNSIGPYGNSDFWDVDEDGYIFSTDTPKVDFEVFEDRLYNVIVVRA